MKFSLFVHMERADTTVPHRRLFDELTEPVLQAEAAGFGSAWIGEHHGMEFTIAPNPLIQLAWLAAKTTRIRLGTGNVIAPFWHPIRLAGEAAMFAVVSDGRLDLGIARGASMFAYERLFPGLDAWGAGQRMHEIVPAIKKPWEGDYAHQGEFWQFPKTVRLPGNPSTTGNRCWTRDHRPCRRHWSAMLSSPRSPTSTLRIFSSAE